MTESISEFEKYKLSWLEHMWIMGVKAKKFDKVLGNKEVTSGWLGDWRCPVCDRITNMYQLYWYDIGHLLSIRCPKCYLCAVVDVFDMNGDEYFKYRVLEIFFWE